MKQYILLLLLLFSFNVNAQLKSFPNAEGAGAYTTGARNDGTVTPTILHVTRLDDDTNSNTYQGTLRWALKQQYPRIIVFDVSGTIRLNQSIGMIGSSNIDKYAHCTVLGQTAPEGGITIEGNGEINFEYQRNIIFRYIRFRNGDYGAQTKSFRTPRSHDVIVDHCGFWYSTDEGMAIAGNTGNRYGGATVQNCLFAENKTGIIFGDSDGEYNDGGWGGASLLRNAFVNCSHRFPKHGGPWHSDAINNVVHNWKWRLLRYDAHDFTLNEINNYYDAGVSTVTSISADNGLDKIFTGANPQIYTNGNYITPSHLSTLGITGYDTDNSKGWSKYYTSWDGNPVPSSWFVSSPLPYDGVTPTIMTAVEAKQYVLANAGPRHYLNADGSVGEYLDNLEVEYLGYIENSNAPALLDYTSEYGEESVGVPNNTRPVGYYNNSKSPDIPETWFDANMTQGQNAYDLAPSGYTWIEEFANNVDTFSQVGDIPVITLIGNSTINLNNGYAYTEQGATASDTEDGDISGNIIITGTVDTNVDGTYYKYYNVTDSDSNNAIQVIRTIHITTPISNIPIITLIGNSIINLNKGDTYTELGATATDVEDDDTILTGNIVIGGDNVNTNIVGTYIVTYNVTDSDTNPAIEVTRTVNVNEINTEYFLKISEKLDSKKTIVKFILTHR